MRPVLHGDVSAAARVLYRLPAAKRLACCRDMIREAQIADRFVRDTGGVHPRFGDGSLICAARKRALAPEPFFDDPEYCDCMAMVLRELALRFRSAAGSRLTPTRN